jgi:hypothetical protein
MRKIEEITLRLYDEDIDDYLKKIGFVPVGPFIFEDIEGRRRIDLNHGIICYSIEGSYMFDDPKIIIQLSFTPEIPILNYLLKRAYFI